MIRLHLQIVIDMPEHSVESKGLGGTMRLGLRTTVFLTDKCILRKNSKSCDFGVWYC